MLGFFFSNRTLSWRRHGQHWRQWRAPLRAASATCSHSPETSRTPPSTLHAALDVKEKYGQQCKRAERLGPNRRSIWSGHFSLIKMAHVTAFGVGDQLVPCTPEFGLQTLGAKRKVMLKYGMSWIWKAALVHPTFLLNSFPSQRRLLLMQ